MRSVPLIDGQPPNRRQHGRAFVRLARDALRVIVESDAGHRAGGDAAFGADRTPDQRRLPDRGLDPGGEHHDPGAYSPGIGAARGRTASRRRAFVGRQRLVAVATSGVASGVTSGPAGGGDDAAARTRKEAAGAQAALDSRADTDRTAASGRVRRFGRMISR
jgi:hypothetical protein